MYKLTVPVTQLVRNPIFQNIARLDAKNCSYLTRDNVNKYSEFKYCVSFYFTPSISMEWK